MSMNNGQESVFEAIAELKEDTGIIKTDIYWIKKAVTEMNEKQSKCNACANSEYIYKQANINRYNIEKLQNERNRIIGISIGCSTIISSIFVALQLGILKLN